MKKRPCNKCGKLSYGKLCRECYCVRIAKRKTRKINKHMGIKLGTRKKYKTQIIKNKTLW